MTIQIVHTFVSLKSDGIDITKVQPSNWNEDHKIVMAAGKILGREVGSDGDVQELGLAFTGGNADFDVGTGYLKIPRGTTAQRPTGAAAMVRYNTDLSGFEKYNTVTSAWDLLASVADLSALLPTGLVAPYIGAAAPTGWVLLTNRTIGNASSGGTERASADCANLFAQLWAFDNTRLPIQNSAGAASTRGANAAADFAANKRMPLLDARGRVIAGLDNMGGTAAGRLVTGLTDGVDGATSGAVGGLDRHVMTLAELVSHGHPVPSRNPDGNQITGGAGAYLNAFFTNDGTSGSTGSGSPSNIVQPTLVLPYIIKL